MPRFFIDVKCKGQKKAEELIRVLKLDDKHRRTGQEPFWGIDCTDGLTVLSSDNKPLLESYASRAKKRVGKDNVSCIMDEENPTGSNMLSHDTV